MKPLRRNRDFVLLQAGQLLSAAGSESVGVVYPLLVLGLTNSPAKAGFVAFVRYLPMALLSLPAGILVDRADRKRLMITADVVRAIAAGGLVAAIAADALAYWQILVVAAVEGSAWALFSPAAGAALRSVVPLGQLPDAAGVQQARTAMVSLVGPPLGGALLALGKALPFAVNAVSYLASTISLALMHTPFQEQRERDSQPLRAQLAEGARFLWSNAFIRTCALLYGLSNVIGPGLLLAVVVIGHSQGLSSAAIGLLLASFGAGVLAGSLLSPILRRRLSTRAVLLLELWTWTASALFLLHPDVYVLMATLIPTAIAIPVTDSVVIGYRLAITPDRLIGRVESVRSTIALLLAPLGPLLAGVLLDRTTERATIAVFAAFGLILAIWGTLSGAIRNAPSLAELSSR
jgi:MFS family permease